MCGGHTEQTKTMGGGFGSEKGGGTSHNAGELFLYRMINGVSGGK